MAVHSLMVPIGENAPGFSLPRADSGEMVSLADYEGRPLLVAFLCNHCPYVKHVEDRLGEILSSFPELAVVGICSNDTDTYPDDAAPHLVEQAQRAGWNFPYLVDDTSAVARSYRAACTPDFFLYNEHHRLVYRGAFDESTPGNNKPVTGELLGEAIRKTLAGEAVPEPHIPSLGCSIKFRS